MAEEPKIRRIAHLDMDAFFASVELLRYPQLKGLPVVIGGSRRSYEEMLARLRTSHPERAWDGNDLHHIPVEAFDTLQNYVGRGVITTATYAARQFGVGSAMGMMKAAKLCPQALLLPVDKAEYGKFSRLFKATILDIAPQMEDRGVDEVYIDFTDVPGGQREGGRVLARLIQRRILEETGLTCSVGVAPNKLLAKMASEFNKPNGISVIYEDDVQGKIWPLACRKINGIGPKADEKLQGHGIRLIGELAQRDEQWLIDSFGQATGAWMFRTARGIDTRPVSLNSEPVTISRETTFERDLHAVHDKAELGAIFTQLCEGLARDLQRKGYLGKTIGIKLRYDNFKAATRDITLDVATADAKTIRHTAGLCVKRAPLERRIRLLGVRVSTLVRTEALLAAQATQVELAAGAEAATQSIPQGVTPELF